jgi:hypothetical protein
VIIGGAVGLIAAFVFPARPRPERFESALSAYRDSIVDTFVAVGRESGTHDRQLPEEELHEYVSLGRRLRDLADTARVELVRLVESAHWNVRGRGVKAGIENRATRLRRLSGIGIQVRGIVGAANRMYDRAGPDPALSADELRVLVDLERDLMGVVLGPPGDQVRGTDRAAAQRLDDELARLLIDTAERIDIEPGRDRGLLAAISLIGRLDHIRGQLADFPGWEE